MPGPGLTAIAPPSVTACKTAQIFTLNGSNLQSGVRVTVYATNFQKTLNPSQVRWISASEVQMSIVTGTAPDNWSVVVSNPDGGRSARVEFRVNAPAVTQSASGKYPIQGPITQPFGVPWSEKCWKTHTGVDIASKKGTAVPSMSQGEIVKVVPLGGDWGYAVVVREKDGAAKGYLHVNPVAKPGPVSTGDTIGTVWKDHLHYNVCTRVEYCWRGALPTAVVDPEYPRDPLFADGPFLKP